MTTQPIIKSFSPELQAAARRHSVGNEGYPFDALQVGQAFELPLDTVDLRHLRSRIVVNNKTGKNFFHVVVRAKNIVEVGRLPDTAPEQKAAQDALTAPSYKPPENGAKGLQPAFAPAPTPYPRLMPSHITATPVNALPDEDDAPSPWLAIRDAGKLMRAATNASPAKAAPGIPPQAPSTEPAPTPTGFLGIPASLLHLTAAEAHEAHVKEQYKRFGVQNYDEMTDDQIAEAQRAIETADAAWEASNVKPTKFPDPSKMAFDAKKTKPTAQAERTPEQIAKYNNRPIPSEEDMASNAAIAEAGRLRWLAQKAEDEKNPLPKSTGWGN